MSKAKLEELVDELTYALGGMTDDRPRSLADELLEGDEDAWAEVTALRDLCDEILDIRGKTT